jgi:hypothetical protein
VASNTDDSQIQSTLADIIANQEIIYGQLQESFIATQQMINDLSTTVQSSQQGNGYNVIQVIDEREIQRQQLQAQIEELKKGMTVHESSTDVDGTIAESTQSKESSDVSTV